MAEYDSRRVDTRSDIYKRMYDIKEGVSVMIHPLLLRLCSIPSLFNVDLSGDTIAAVISSLPFLSATSFGSFPLLSHYFTG